MYIPHVLCFKEKGPVKGLMFSQWQNKLGDDLMFWQQTSLINLIGMTSALRKKCFSLLLHVCAERMQHLQQFPHEDNKCILLHRNPNGFTQHLYLWVKKKSHPSHHNNNIAWVGCREHCTTPNQKYCNYSKLLFWCILIAAAHHDVFANGGLRIMYGAYVSV